MGVSYLIIHCFQDLSRNMVRSKCLLSAVPFSQDPVRKGQKKTFGQGYTMATPRRFLKPSNVQKYSIAKQTLPDQLSGTLSLALQFLPQHYDKQ
jgi:hypothetical protein